VTNLCEDGRDTRYIQKFLGHSSIKTTTIYMRLTKSAVDKIKSPLDISVDEK
jgi:site-specific recombinase XerD